MATDLAARVPLHVERWGRVSWREARQRQEWWWQELQRNAQAPDGLFLLEHDPVFTLGKRARDSHLLVAKDALRERGFDVVEADRGGEVTYHGPGQLVVYVVASLPRLGVGAADLVRTLAEALRSVIAAFGIEARYDPQRPGLWVGDAKIAAVGMRIRRNVSLHGVALNVTTVLEDYRWIVPCGLPDAPVTSVLDQGVRGIAVPDLLSPVQTALLALFPWRLSDGPVDDGWHAEAAATPWPAP